MSISTPALTNFTGGEISPRLDGRVDLSKYFNGCKKLENFLVHPHGGATRRNGFRFVAEAKHHDKKVGLLPFEFNASQTYMLEFGDFYMRVYHDRGKVMTEADPDVLYERATPFTADQLDGLYFAQSADTMYIVHPSHKPQKLQRINHDDWTLADVAWTGEPSDWDADNYPSVVGFYQQRLVIGGTPNQPNTLWLSKSAGIFDDLTIGTADDMGMKYTFDSESMDIINGLALGSKRLVVLTEGGEWTIGAGSFDSEVLTPTNVKADQWTTVGSEGIRPIRTSNAVLFFDASGQRLHELAYVFESDGFATPDLTLLAEHMGSHHRFIDSAFARTPESVMFAVRDDGVLCGLTYARDHEVVAWHRHLTDGVFEAVAAIHGGDRTEVWVVVKRTVNGQDKRFIELLDGPFNGNIEDAFFLDCGLSYSEGSPTRDFTGADHLAGCTVSALVDGAVHPDVAIAQDGTFSLDRDATKVHIGFSYTSKLQPMRLEGGSQRGTAQTKKKRITKVSARFHETLGGKIGPDETHLEPVYFRSPSTPMGQSAGAWSGDKTVNFPKGWNKDGLLTIVQDQPLPMTVLMVVPEQVINQ